MAEKLQIDVSLNVKGDNALKELGAKFRTNQQEIAKNVLKLNELKNANQQNSKEYIELKKAVDLAKTSQENFGKSIKALTRESKGLTAEVKASKFQILEFYENITVAGAGAIIAIKKIADVIADSVKAFAQDEAAAQKLFYALDGNTESFGRLQGFVNEFQNKTGIFDDQINSSLSFLALQGRTEEQMKKIITTAAGMTQVLDIDLNTAVRQLDATYEGNIGRMGKLDSDLKLLSTTELENGAAVDLLYQKYGSLAEQMGNTTAGKMKILEAKLGDLKEAFGQGIVQGFLGDMEDSAKSTQDLVLELDSLKSIIIELGKLVTDSAGLPSFVKTLADLKAGTLSWQDALKGVIYTATSSMPLVGTELVKLGELMGILSGETKKVTRDMYNLLNYAADVSETMQPLFNLLGVTGRYNVSKGDESMFDAKKAERDKSTPKTGRGGTPRNIEKDKKDVIDFSKAFDKLFESVSNLEPLMDFIRSEVSWIGTGLISEDTKIKFRVFNDELLTLSERMKEGERMAAMNQILSDSFVTLADSMKVFMESLVSGDADGFKSFMKSIVNTMITSVQAMLFAAGSAAAAKGITSFGLTLLTDLPQIAAAWIGLELAKGVIQGLAEGGQVSGGTPYIVGERGKELFIPSQNGMIINNRDFGMMSRGAGAAQNVYISADIDGVRFLKSAFPKYVNYKKFKMV